MSRIMRGIEKYFWILFAVGFLVGVLVPAYGRSAQALLVPLLMVILFFTFLKVDMQAAVPHMKKPIFMILLMACFLIVIPWVVYVALKGSDAQRALGFLLLAAMPPGVAAPVLTEIVKGNAPLALILSSLGHLCVPFTLPWLLSLTLGANIQVERGALFQSLAVLIFVPLLLAQGARRYMKEKIAKAALYFTPINIVVMSVILYIAMAGQSEQFMHGGSGLVKEIAWLYAFFIVLHFIGYMIIWRRPKEERIAAAVSKSYMNNALAIVIASTFFPDPRVVFITVASELPWTTLLGPFRWSLRFLK